jgi:hypothetical protein
LRLQSVTEGLIRRVSRAPTASYVAASGALYVLVLVQTLNQQWGRDFWVHLATIREIALRPWDPTQPLVGANVPDPLISPYMLVLGLVTRVVALDPVTVLAVVGALNLGLLLYALRRFVLEFTDRSGAAIWTLLFTLLAWGFFPWRWSGYLNLNAIGFGPMYPAIFATAVGLLLLAHEHRWIVAGGVRHLVFVGIAIPIVVLTHPFTAAWTAIAAVAVVVAQLRPGRLARTAWLISVGAAGMMLALQWPYFSLLQLAEMSGDFDAVHRALYGGILSRSFLALPGVVALAWRAKADPRDPLVWSFAGTLAVFIFGGLTQRWSLGRVFPGMMLAAHVALGDAVARYLSSDVRTRKRALLGATAIVVVGAAGCAPGILRMVPRPLLPEPLASDARLGSIVEAYRALPNIIGPDESVVASPSLNQAVAGISGNVLVPPVPTFLEDLPQRIRAGRTILDPSIGARERQALLDRWDISFLVLTPSDAAALAPDLSSGPVLQTDRFAVFDVTAQGPDAETTLD